MGIFCQFQKYSFYHRDYKEYNTDTAVHFIVMMSRDKLIDLEKDGLHKAFKLQTTTTITSMVRYRNNDIVSIINETEICQRYLFIAVCI